jgi:hypothetical protein
MSEKLFLYRLSRAVLNSNMVDKMLNSNMVDEVMYFIKILDLENNDIPYPGISMWSNGVELVWSVKYRSFVVYISYNGDIDIFYRNPLDSMDTWLVRTNINNFGTHNLGFTYTKVKSCLNSISHI